MTCGRIGRIVSEIGEKAGIVIDKREGRYVTAHDLRRSFATRWAPRGKPVTLQRLMRHKSIETTLKYHVDLDDDEIADELRRNHGVINTYINSRPSEDSDGPNSAARQNP